MRDHGADRRSPPDPEDIGPMDGSLQGPGVENPFILAPMGGGPGTPELVAAVSNAGGQGSLTAAKVTPEQIAREDDPR